MFEVGQHVVCIIDIEGRISDFIRRLYKSKGLSFPVKGTVYTVREVYTAIDVPERVGVRLVELVNPAVLCASGFIDEPGFDAGYFRPLKKLKVEDFMGVRIDENA